MLRRALTLAFVSLLLGVQHHSIALAAEANARGVKASTQAVPSMAAATNAFNARNYQTALVMFTAIVRAQPSNINAYYYLALCQHALGDTIGSRRMHDYIVQNFPDSPAAINSKAYLGKLMGGASAPPGSGMTASAQSSAIDLAKAAEDLAELANASVPASIASLVEVVRNRGDRPPVSKEAVAAIKTAVDGMPKAVKAKLWLHRVKIYVTPTVEDFEPGVKYQEARGYEGGTYKSCPAFYSNGRIVIAERTMNEDESVKDAFESSQMVNSLFHETGHALDFTAGVSHSEGFKHSYLLDCGRIEPEIASKLRYYLQKSEAGQEECCAELVGLLLGQTERHTAEMKVAFPLTLKFLRAKLGI